MSQDPSPRPRLTQRRRFLNLGLATIASGVLANGNNKATLAQAPGVANDESGAGTRSGVDPSGQRIDIEKWRKLRSEPYEIGSFGEMPGVCNLPGPLAKRNWPDRTSTKGRSRFPECASCAARSAASLVMSRMDAS